MTMRKVYTLVFLKNADKVLLGHKTRGLGQGYWNGFGGKVECGETILEGANREVKEECNLECLELNHLGVVEIGASGEKKSDFIHIFTSNKFQGEERASEEMNPIEWYKLDNIPCENMWPHFKRWHSLMLKESHFSAYFLYDENNNLLRDCIKVCENIKDALEHANLSKEN